MCAKKKIGWKPLSRTSLSCHYSAHRYRQVHLSLVRNSIVDNVEIVMENPDRNAVVKVEDCDESFEFGCEVGIEESHDLCGTSQELEIQEDLAKKPESNCSCNGSGAQYNIGIGKAEHVSVGSPACQNGGPQQKASAGSESSVPGEEDQETSQTPGTTVEVKSSTGMIQIHLTIVNVQSDRVLNQVRISYSFVFVSGAVSRKPDGFYRRDNGSKKP